MFARVPTVYFPVLPAQCLLSTRSECNYWELNVQPVNEELSGYNDQRL